MKLIIFDPISLFATPQEYFIMMVFRLFSYKRHFTTSKGAKRLETGKTKRTLHVKNAFPSFANFWIDKTRLKGIFFLKLWKKMVLFFKNHSTYHNFKRDISSILFSLKNISTTKQLLTTKFT